MYIKLHQHMAESPQVHVARSSRDASPRVKASAQGRRGGHNFKLKPVGPLTTIAGFAVPIAEASARHFNHAG
jgi:hypothetical protein